MSEFTRVERPKNCLHIGPHRGPFTLALRETLTSGDAIAVPLNGDTYAVLRNRLCARAQRTSKDKLATLRTMKSADGSHALIWLEPKTDGEDAGSTNEKADA